ncbi:amidohydrolase [Streptomyces canus]|uniref:amidohydrolase n=1 Tax=Streptomyces canus TaxID=58343 RepID=UPI0038180376
MSHRNGRVTVFRNGAIFTGLPASPWSDAVAVRDGVVAAVGGLSVSNLQDEAGALEVVDLRGGLLAPGFIDAHAHPIMGGLEKLRCDLSDLTTAAAYAERIAGYAADHPADAWIIGGGWSMEAFPRGVPTCAVLDEIVPDRPAYFPNRDHHSSWVNTKALEAAGISAITPDPIGGRIERDEHGIPTGCLHESAMGLVEAILPAATESELDDALQTAQEHFHSLGIVGWQDAAVWTGQGGSLSLHAAYLRAQERGTLTARVTGALWWERGTPYDQVAAEVVRLCDLRAQTLRDSRYRATSVKIMQDGVLETYTAALLEPYLDGCGCPTPNTGISFLEPELLRLVVGELDRHGFDLHFHALGDRAVREVLDAIEQARRTCPLSDGRHHLAHLQLVSADDLARLRRLRLTANLQPLWARHDPQVDLLTTPFIGTERGEEQYPFGDFARHGVALAMGSDWPVSSADPIAGIHVAVNRIAYGRDSAPLGLRQGLTLASSLSAYTAGSAYLNRIEKTSGVISEGMAADLVVLSENPFDAPASEIGRARVRHTYVDGRLVYDADS